MTIPGTVLYYPCVNGCKPIRYLYINKKAPYTLYKALKLVWGLMLMTIPGTVLYYPCVNGCKPSLRYLNKHINKKAPYNLYEAFKVSVGLDAHDHPRYSFILPLCERV